MIRLPPITRISIGLVLLTVSILLGSDLLGLIPDRSSVVLTERIRLCESLAVQFSVAAQKEDKAAMAAVLRGLVERNEEVLSAAVRRKEGSLMVKAGDHDRHWDTAPPKDSTPSHVRVPIFKGDRLWGTVETRFKPLKDGILGFRVGTLFRLIVFVMFTGFMTYRYFMKKTLKHLDPSSVIPPRVKATLDTLVEGVVLIDSEEQIVLANRAFEKIVGLSASSLLGRKISEMNWVMPEPDKHIQDFPWLQALGRKQSQNSVRIFLNRSHGARRTFMVNSSPILDAGGKCRGVLATFDDVTQVEKQNEHLQEMLEELEKSRDRVRRQNNILEVLAKQDSLTGCLNRRAFFEEIEGYLREEKDNGLELSCIMVDIDHFKSINDRYGHVTGDQVLKEVARVIREQLREIDLVCRYGGEEFCIVLPRVGLADAAQKAEKLRGCIESIKFSGIPATASFGVSSLGPEVNQFSEALQHADQALYAAKLDGRNRVKSWKQMNTKTDLIRSETAAYPV